MIANNIFRAFGSFCTEIAFGIFDILRSADGWWTSNVMSIFLISSGFIALFYWLGRMTKDLRAGTEDL